MVALPVGSTELEHRVVASVATDDGFRMECVCGWSADVGTPLGLFDAWADHCVHDGPT
jgi:hypothetical protein